MVLLVLRLSVPLKGVKQGCPLSPILFVLFLSDVGASLGMRHSTGRMGVPLQNVESGQSGVRHALHLLFADDLAVVDTSQKHLSSQIHSLLRYGNGKGLTVSVSKCALLVTGMRDGGARCIMAMTTCPMSESSVTWKCGSTRL
jgi:hypothetical protein